MVDLKSSTEPSECRGSREESHHAYVYIMTNRKNGILYVGATIDIVKRATEHRLKILKGFTTRYNLDKLVYYERLDSKELAFKREKQLKKYIRQYKINLIELNNDSWRDLYNEVVEELEIKN